MEGAVREMVPRGEEARMETSDKRERANKGAGKEHAIGAER